MNKGENMLKKLLSVYLAMNLAALTLAPAGTAFAQGKKTYIIGIMNLDAKGVSEVEADVLSEKLRSHVTQLLLSGEYRAMDDKDQYEVVEREDMDKIFEEFDLQSSGCVSDSCAIEFGKMLSADRILQGSIGKIGSTFSVSARILDVEHTKTVVNVNLQHRGSIDDLLSTVIPEVGNELFLGKQKKSKMLWYVLGGVLIAGAGAGAAMGGGGGGGDSGGSTGPALLPTPPSRP